LTARLVAPVPAIAWPNEEIVSRESAGQPRIRINLRRLFVFHRFVYGLLRQSFYGVIAKTKLFHFSDYFCELWHSNLPALNELFL
jgi:hypothetical protein